MKEMMKKILDKDNLIPLCFMLLPFMIILVAMPLSGSGVTIHVSHHYALFIFGVIMATILVKNRWLSAFMIYACIWTLFILIYTVKNPQVPSMVTKNAFDALTFLLIGALAYVLIINSKIKKETFYNLICISALLQAGIALCQYLYSDPFLWLVNTGFHKATPLLDPHTLTGTLGNNNFLAAYLAISLPFFFRRNWYYGIIPIAVCFYLSVTTSAFIPALIGASFFFGKRINSMGLKYSIPIWIICIAVGIHYAFFYHPFVSSIAVFTAISSSLTATSEVNGAYNPRFDFWVEALRQVFSHPVTVIIGMGPGAGWGKPFPLHNEWLQCLHQYGLIGLSLLVGHVLTVYRGNRMLFTAFIIAAINMFGNYSLHLAPSAFLIILIAALMEREKGITRGPDSTWGTGI